MLRDLRPEVVDTRDWSRGIRYITRGYMGAMGTKGAAAFPDAIGNGAGEPRHGGRRAIAS